MTDKVQEATSAEAPSSGVVRGPRRAYKAGVAPDRFTLPDRAEDIAPELAAGFDQVVAVRRALYQALPVTVGGHVVEFDHRATYGEIVQRLRAEGGGLWCAGSAFVFQRALEALGYKAWTLHFGFDDDLTHAVVVVQVGERLLVQDVYLNEGYSIDIRELLPRLQQGADAPVHRETRDRKVHLIPRDHEDRLDLDWYERIAELELPPLGAFRRFVLVPYAHRQRVMRSWTGKNAERLRQLALPQDDLFLLLNPIGVFDGEHFESAPQRMPIVRDWIAGGGRTLAQQLRALELDTNAQTDEASRTTLRSLINQITSLRDQCDALQSELGEARESAAEEQAKFIANSAHLAGEVQRLTAAGAEAGARQAAEAEALLSQAAAERARHAAELQALIDKAAAERARHASELHSLKERAAMERAQAEAAAAAERSRVEVGAAAERVRHGEEIQQIGALAATERERRAAEIATLLSERDAAVAKLAEIEADREALIRALAEFEQRARKEVEAAESERKDAMRRAGKLEKRNAELESALSLIAAELAALDGAATDPKMTPERRALVSTRRLVGETHSQTTKIRMLERKLDDLMQERRAMMQEINHLNAVVNNSRYLRTRRWLTKVLKR